MKVLIAIAAALFAQQATAQAMNQCAPHDAVTANLKDKYGETRQSMGMAGENTAVVEMFANTDTGSWTITVTRPGQLTCLLASGQMFAIIPQGVEG